MKVLVAEDNLINQKLLSIMLKRLGCLCVFVGDGQEALHAVLHEEFVAVLMDIQMPVMNGLEATAAIRNQESPGRKNYIIAQSAHALKEEIEKCYLVGMDDCLLKPISSKSLHQALAKAFAKSVGLSIS